MKCKWVIEGGDIERENWDKIAEYLKNTGREFVRTKYIPFSTDKLNTSFGDEDCVVAFGCLGMVRSVGLKNKWIPGVWCDWDKLKCSYYLSRWWDFSVQRMISFYPLSHIWAEKDFLFEAFGRDGHIFVRPDDNFKTFNGELVAIENWEQFRRNVECYEPEPHTLCMVSRPEPVSDEWRFVIADGKVVTGSQYRKNRSAEISSDVDPKALVFTEEILAKSEWRPHPVFTMDICRVGHEYRLMEIGSINGAGLYACDIPSVVEAVCRVAEREWAEVYSPV